MKIRRTVRRPATCAGADVLLLAHDEHLGAGDAGEERPAEQRQADVDPGQPGTEDGDEGHHEDHEREREHDVDDAHDHGVEPAAEVAGNAAEQDADQPRP